MRIDEDVSDLIFRCLFSTIFLGLGLEHLLSDELLRGLIPDWIGAKRMVSASAGVVLLTGGCSILLGWKTHLGAWLLEVLGARKARVDDPVPSEAGVGGRQLDPLRLEVAVEDEEEPTPFEVARLLAGIELVAERPESRIVPVRPAEVRCKPGEVRDVIVVQVLAQEELPALEDREAARQGDGLSEEV